MYNLTKEQISVQKIANKLNEKKIDLLKNELFFLKLELEKEKNFLVKNYLINLISSKKKSLDLLEITFLRTTKIISKL